MDCACRSQQPGCFGCQPMIQPPVQPAMPMEMPTGMPSAGTQVGRPSMMMPQMPLFVQREQFCPDTSPGGMEQYPVGMGYIPWQQWQQTYPLERAFHRGTIFPDLDLPFMRGGCR